MLCISLIIFVSVSCQQKTKVNTDESSLTIHYFGDESIAGPYWDSSTKFLVFNSLTAMNKQGELESRLAESWEHTEDYRTWTIHLRQDVHWHDGEPFTVHDIKFTMELLAHADVGMETPESFTIRVIDDWTYTISYHKRTNSSLFPLSSWTVFYPKHLLEHLDPKEFRNWEFWKQPVGTGPFRYVRHVPKTMVEYEANPDYFRGKPKIDRVRLRFGSEYSLIELLAGNVDVSEINKLDVLKLKNDRRFNIHPYLNTAFMFTILWNHNRRLFDDVRIRSALTMAINRCELHKVLNLPDNIPLADTLATEFQYMRQEYPEPLPFDPDAAKKLLEDAGWRDNDGDDILERGDEKFIFTLHTWAEAEDFTVYIQESLRRMGIKMQIQTLDRRVVNQRVESGEFDAVLRGIWERFYVTFFGKDSLIGYKNTEVIRFLDTWEKAVTGEESNEAYRKLMPLFQKDHPVTILAPLANFFAAPKNLKGLISPYLSDPIWYIENLWIEEE